jgi:hypothetical protein
MQIKKIILLTFNSSNNINVINKIKNGIRPTKTFNIKNAKILFISNFIFDTCLLIIENEDLTDE